MSSHCVFGVRIPSIRRILHLGPTGTKKSIDSKHSHHTLSRDPTVHMALVFGFVEGTIPGVMEPYKSTSEELHSNYYTTSLQSPPTLRYEVPCNECNDFSILVPNRLLLVPLRHFLHCETFQRSVDNEGKIDDLLEQYDNPEW
jgi:hypothetical protein